VGFEPCVVYRSAREDWVQTMVAAGLGIAMLNDGFVHAHLASLKELGGLRRRPDVGGQALETDPLR